MKGPSSMVNVKPRTPGLDPFMRYCKQFLEVVFELGERPNQVGCYTDNGHSNMAAVQVGPLRQQLDPNLIERL